MTDNYLFKNHYKHFTLKSHNYRTLQTPNNSSNQNYATISSMIPIQENALFIADAHYPTHGDALLELLTKIEVGDIRIPQLFLMGDIFDLLVGGLEKSYALNEEAIRLIESIGTQLPVFYFEGNHDFQLKKIFKNIKIFSREEQPQYMGYNGFIVGLSHGDRYQSGWQHDLFSRVLRKSFILTTIKWLKPGIVTQKRAHLATKDICHQIPAFGTKAKAIFDSYKGAYWVIEGHYHQGKKYYRYVSLPSLACQQQVAVMEKEGIVFVSIDTLEGDR